MWSRKVLWLIFCINMFGFADAQSGQPQEKTKYVVVPPTAKYLLSVVSQPDCPLQIEKAELHIGVNCEGSCWGVNYLLRNRGSSPLKIKAVTIAVWTVGGAGFSGGNTLEDNKEIVMPGEVVPLKDYSNGEIIPLTKELSDKLGLQKPLDQIVIMLIEKITFTNGTVYDAGQRSKALQNYLMNIPFPDDIKDTANNFKNDL